MFESKNLTFKGFFIQNIVLIYRRISINHCARVLHHCHGLVVATNKTLWVQRIEIPLVVAVNLNNCQGCC